MDNCYFCKKINSPIRFPFTNKAVCTDCLPFKNPVKQCEKDINYIFPLYNPYDLSYKNINRNLFFK